MSSPDLCDRCGCRWHGLPCEYTTSRFYDGTLTAVTCGCATSFENRFDAILWSPVE